MNITEWQKATDEKMQHGNATLLLAKIPILERMNEQIAKCRVYGKGGNEKGGHGSSPAGHGRSANACGGLGRHGANN